ncbi:unnamed protein product [Allacma fusca]|uniref:CCHC-type domain-containing protein n=1 Tax=Allacma fusca TaxID=39272 RepID=A0A8J2P2I6_9HEXA|nr:unnamed protein product [Allacma fusca]
MPCSMCGQSGHNRRTCSAGDRSAGSNLSFTSSFLQDSRAPSSSSRTASILMKESHTTRVSCCSNCGKPGHNIRTCPKTSPACLERACSGCRKPGHNIQTCPIRSMSTSASARYPAEAFEKPKSSVDKIKGSDEKLKLAPKIILHKFDDNKALNPDILELVLKNIHKSRLEIEDVTTKGKELFRPKNFKPSSYLTDSAKVKQRFKEGPTAEDGPGYIYIYEYLPTGSKDPKVEELKSMYKIGMSEHIPEGRRIRDQENRNGEKYRVVYTVPVAHRKLTEAIIHLQLEHRRRKRDVIDGKTEWFQGDKNRLKEVVNDGKAIVESVYEGEAPKSGL